MTGFKPWPMLALLGLCLIAACDERGASGGGDSLGQVVARVNGEEITVSQLNAELASVSADTQDRKAVEEEVLRTIVFRTLLRQAAIKSKLDRKPDIRLLMDAARDKVLAESYMDQVTGTNKEPTAQEIAKYISDHPLAFGERRIYHFQRLMLAADKYSDWMQPMFDMKPQAQTFDQLEEYLKGQGIGYTLVDVQLPSTDFPEQVQKRLLQFGIGDNVVVRGPQSIIILKIKGWTAMPVQQADAEHVASAAIRQEQAAERTEALRAQMLHDAKITFSGAFAKISADEPETLAPAAGSAAKAALLPAGADFAPSNGPDIGALELELPMAAPTANSAIPQEGTAP